MPASTLSGHSEQLQALAAAWLATGATGFGLWINGEPVAQWPPAARLPAADLVAQVPGPTPGELRVAGVQGQAAQARLDADATLWSSLVSLEAEADSLIDALAETEDQLLALYELSKAHSDWPNIDPMLNRLVRQAARMAKAEAAFAVLAPARVVRTPGLATPEPALIDLFAQVRAAGRELLLPAASWANSGPSGEANLFLVPLPQRQGSQVVAALGLWLDIPAAALSPALKLARSVAEQVGAQIEIALLHEELVAQARLQAEMALARQVQADLLPKRSPELSGLDIDGVSHPALQVGGDFYDYMMPTPIKGRPFTFVVGDVSGKGLSAALLMATTRTNLRSGFLHAVICTPEAILSRANQDLYEDFSEVGMMATVFVGQYDRAAGMLYYANAGHSPVILRPANGSALLLEADGPALGVLPNLISRNQKTPFGTGDILVVATDGFHEQRNAANEFYGMERLLDQVEALAACSAQGIAQGLLAAVAQFSAGKTQDDDQTVIVLKGQ